MVGRAYRVRWEFRAAAALPVLLAALLVAACGSNGAPPAPAGAAGAAGVSIGPESVVTVTAGEIRTGPLLSGELRAAREATVRAKMSGSVLEVRVEEGQPVRQGAVIARIEARPLQDALLSSQSALRSAEQSLAVAEREADRTASLVKGGRWPSAIWNSRARPSRGRRRSWLTPARGSPRCASNWTMPSSRPPSAAW